MSRLSPLLFVVVIALAGCAKANPTLPRVPKTASKAPAYRPPSTSSVSAPATGVSKGAGYITSLGAVEPATAAGGDRLAFRVPGRGLFVSTSEGGNPRPVANSIETDKDPAWTEAGDLLVAVRADATGSALVALPPGGQAERLYTSKATLRQPAYVPGSGGWLVVEEDGRTGRLLRVARSGGTADTLAEGALMSSPAVTPDGGSAIVERRGAAGGTELARVPLTGGGATTLKVIGTNPRSPAFAPSGRQLAYLSDEGVYISDATGTGGRLVQAGKAFDGLSWHPKGTGLVVGAKDAGRTDLIRISL